jgi:outer membrane lipoprotein-sorting protein
MNYYGIFTIQPGNIVIIGVVTDNLRSYLMSRNKKLWIFVGSVIFVAALISGFVLMQPSAQEILVSSFESTKTITDGHAVVSIEVDTVDENASGTFEVWAIRNEDGPGGFRVEVLESSEEKAQGAVIVSDGSTLWAYSPAENEAFVGTPEEAKAMMKENDQFSGQFGKIPQHFGNEFKDGEHEAPKNADEAVQKLQEYFNIGISGTDTVAGETSALLKLEPIPEQMPGEYLAVGGFINLWISQNSQMPLAFEFTGSSLGEVSMTVLEYDINAGVDEALFTYEIPESADLITFADLEPQSLTLEEAGEYTDFEFLTPADIPTGATLVDIFEVRGALVLHYTLQEGGAYTISQGIIQEKTGSSESKPGYSQDVEVRGTTGQLFESEDGSKVLLTWAEGQQYYSISGVISAEEAVNIADSLQ